jgi:hypothetical protein
MAMPCITNIKTHIMRALVNAAAMPEITRRNIDGPSDGPTSVALRSLKLPETLKLAETDAIA